MVVTGFAGDVMTSGFTMVVGMKWTNDKPSVEGWYLWRLRGKSQDSFHWLAYFYEAEMNQVWSDGTTMVMPDGGQWAGPIPEPDNES